MFRAVLCGNFVCANLDGLLFERRILRQKYLTATPVIQILSPVIRILLPETFTLFVYNNNNDLLSL